MTDLHDLLDLATDRVEAAGLSNGVLAEAHRRRVRQRGAVAGAVAAALVVAVLVTVRLTTGATTGGSVPPAESPSPTPDVTAVAPAIPRSAIQPVWDPRGAEGLPVVELGVPRVMESLVPGDVDQPVALLDDGSRVLLVSADGLSEELDLPDGLGQWRTVSLSPDGTRLAAVGFSGFFWRPLDGDWERIDVGEEQQVTDGDTRITWAPDSKSLVLRSHLDGVQVDLDSGELTPLPMVRNYRTWAFAPDGSIVTVSSVLREWVEGGEAADGTELGDLENLQRPAVGETSVAATRGDGSYYGGKPGPADRDGLIAVERGTLATRAFLPVADDDYWYSDGGKLSAVAWLDDDTVLLNVLPEDAPKEYLLTWNVETGELSRISCWLRNFDAVFATDLLGRS